MLLAALLGFGWLIGVSAPAMAEHFTTAYLNHYHAATATPNGTINYYVTSSDERSLQQLVDSQANLTELSKTPFDEVYTVQLNAASRSAMVKELRALSSVSAVFNIPLFCH